MPELRALKVFDDYSHDKFKTDHKQGASPSKHWTAKPQPIAIQTLLNSPPTDSPKRDLKSSTTAAPFQTERHRIPSELQSALNELLPEQAAFYLGEKTDVFDLQYQKDKEASKKKYEGFTGSMKYYAIKVGQQALDWISTILSSPLMQSTGSHVGVLIDPALQGVAWNEARLKNKHHAEQTKESEGLGKRILDNSQLTGHELEEIKKVRLDKIKENKEVESIFQLENPSAHERFTAQQLIQSITNNTSLTSTHVRLLNGFIKELNLDEEKTISFADLQDKYTNHTVGLSIMARHALIEQNKIKNKTEKKIFQWERTNNGIQFNISVATAITWFTLNVVMWAGVGVSSAALPAVGYTALGIGCALSLIGLGILAYRSPHQFIEVMKLTYIRKSINWMKNYTLKHILGNNKQAVKNAQVRVEQYSEQLQALRVSEDKYSSLAKRAKDKLTLMEIDDTKFYIDTKEFKHINKKLQNEQKNIEKIKGRLESISAGAAYYEDKITTAKIKDHQRTHRMYEKVEGKKQYIESFMDEVALIAANDISRHADDKLANDLAHLLVRQYGVAIAVNKDQALTPAELHKSIHKGIETFVGGDNDRINKINLRLRHAQKSTHRMVLHGALYHKRNQTQARQILNKYGFDVQPVKKETPENLKKQAEFLRRQISNKLPKEEAMVLYGELWNLIRTNNATK
ncbi:MAG: hypothetical protein WC222_04505 [Parachlamydiales bacterium]|jgi:hypothetical protein